jgi:hypothetical protein
VRFVVGAVRSAVASICGPENEKTVTVSGGGGASELELDAGVRVNGRVHLVPASACVYAHITGAVRGTVARVGGLTIVLRYPQALRP